MNNIGTIPLLPVIGTSGKLTEKKDNKLYENFSEVLKDAINNLNSVQKNADQKMIDFAKGDIQSIHEVSIAVSKADIALSLAIEIRNRILEAYREITRMQI